MAEQPQNVQPPVPAGKARIVVDDFSVWYDDQAALRNINLEILAHERLAIIGPARSGKTTLLRSLNRLNDLDERAGHAGQILLDGQNIFDERMNVAVLRRRLGMVYATPTPLPWTIYENIVYGLRLAGVRSRTRMDEAVERSLRSAYIWDELKDRLHEPASNLSGGQQQRMCLARVLALEPEVLLLDEPCSGLDPISTARIEEALHELKSRYAIVLVTNNTKQAARASDRTAFFLMGELIEIGPTAKLFTAPDHSRTNDYLTGSFG